MTPAPTPTTIVHSVSRDAWIKRAREQHDFCDLTTQEQEQLAASFGQKIPKNLDAIGRMQWATNFERRLANGWAIPGDKTTEITLGTLGM